MSNRNNQFEPPSSWLGPYKPKTAKARPPTTATTPAVALAARPVEVLEVDAGFGVAEAMVLFGLIVCVDVCTATEPEVLERLPVVVTEWEWVSVAPPVPVGFVVPSVVVAVVSVTSALEPPVMRKPGDHCQ